MKNLRYFLLLLFFVPGLALAQDTTDVVTVVSDGVEHPAAAALFGAPFIVGNTIGPEQLVQIEPAIGCVEGGCETPDANGFCPAADNAAELEGNIALISRGSCSFTTKVQAASDAGAIGVIIHNDDRVGPGDSTLVNMSGECPPSVCSAPAVFVSRASGLTLIEGAKFGFDASLVPEEPPPPPASVAIDNGTIVTSLFERGFIGSDPTFGFGEGFVFNGANGLFVSSFLAAVDGNVVSNPYDGVSEYENILFPEFLGTPPAPFTVGAVTEFGSTEENVGITTVARLLAVADQPYVIAEFDVTNASGAAIEDLYLGIFADWDVGTTSGDDEGAVNEDLNLVYVYDPAEADTPYFGVAALEADGVDIENLAGYGTTVTSADDAQLFDALSMPVDTTDTAQEQATVIGIGPYDLAAGETVTVRFAYVAGEDEAALFANAMAAQNPGVAVEQTTPEGTYVLGSAFPNPLSSRATIGFELPTAQDVTLKVYDVLGREVATLVEGVRQAGPQTVEFDASSLPSGTYIYRLEAGSTQLMERMTVVR